MKRFLLLLMSILLSGGTLLQAEPVSESRAREIAMKVLAAQPATKAASGDVKLIWNGEDAATKAAAQPAFYVFGSDRGGFVIVAGDDNVQPILAISDENAFQVEGMPSNVRAWMDYIKGYVRSATTRSPEVAQQWAQLTATKAPVDSGGLTNKSYTSRTVQWNQNAPANAQAPTVNGDQEQAIAGCVPVAMAEILTWFKWPNVGVGSTESYNSEMYNTNGTFAGYYPMAAYDLAANFSMTSDEWTALKALDTYSQFQTCTEPIRSKLALLVKVCGLLVKANYNDFDHTGTSAVTALVPQAFAEHMDYNRGSYFDFLSNHTVREWNTILKTQVLLHPVLYSGRASSGSGNDVGHAYVIDGYATLGVEDVFHFNFGWGGNCNGYYYASYQNLTPNSGYVYNLNLEALMDFIPDKDGSSVALRKLAFTSGTVIISGTPCTFTGIQTNTTLEKNVPAPLEIGRIYNSTTAAYLGRVRVSLENKNGAVKQENVLNYSYLDLSGLPPRYFSYFRYEEGITATIETDIEFGDKLVVYYTDNADQDNYVKMTGPRDGTCVLELPVIPAAFIKTKADYDQYDYFEFELLNNDYVYAGTVWTITEPDGTINMGLAQSSREFQLIQVGTYKIEAAVAPAVGDPVVETITTYITVD